jgi:protein-tyrosine phosphatase
MKTELFWIEGPWPGRLAILPRPRGGDWLEDEVRSWRQAGVGAVVSLLTSEEAADLDLVHEAELCRANQMDFVSFPIVDRSVPPSQKETVALVQRLDALLTAGTNVVIHCRQGLGRAALIAACTLVRAGIDPEAAFRRVSTARGCSVPETTEQRHWAIAFARTLAALPVKAAIPEPSAQIIR